MIKSITIIVAIYSMLLSIGISVSSGETILFQNGLQVNGLIYGGTQDTYTGEGYPNMTYGSARETHTLRAPIFPYAMECTVLIKFDDLGKFLPDNFVVQSARIGFTICEYVSRGAVNIEVAELLKPWDNTDLTWTQDGLGNQWSRAGALGIDANGVISADRSDVVMDSVLVPAETEPYGNPWWWNVDPNMVQRWIRNDNSNYGVVFYCPRDSDGSIVVVGRAGTIGLFGENWIPLRPQLEVTGFVATQCSDFIENNKDYAEDFNHDCLIDTKDLESFVESWLACNDPQNPACSN